MPTVAIVSAVADEVDPHPRVHQWREPGRRWALAAQGVGDALPLACPRRFAGPRSRAVGGKHDKGSSRYSSRSPPPTASSAASARVCVPPSVRTGSQRTAVVWAVVEAPSTAAPEPAATSQPEAEDGADREDEFDRDLYAQQLLKRGPWRAPSASRASFSPCL